MMLNRRLMIAKVAKNKWHWVFISKGAFISLTRRLRKHHRERGRMCVSTRKQRDLESVFSVCHNHCNCELTIVVASWTFLHWTGPFNVCMDRGRSHRTLHFPELLAIAGFWVNRPSYSSVVYPMVSPVGTNG